MTENIEAIEPPKNKGGRPKGTTKEKGGKNFWIPADLVDTVVMLLQANRQANQRQQVQP